MNETHDPTQYYPIQVNTPPDVTSTEGSVASSEDDQLPTNETAHPSGIIPIEQLSDAENLEVQLEQISPVVLMTHAGNSHQFFQCEATLYNSIFNHLDATYAHFAIYPGLFFVNFDYCCATAINPIGCMTANQYSATQVLYASADNPQTFTALADYPLPEHMQDQLTHIRPARIYALLNTLEVVMVQIGQASIATYDALNGYRLDEDIADLILQFISLASSFQFLRQKAQ